MSVWCSLSNLLSPTHRFSSEAAEQFEACHHLPSMSTKRLDLPCSFTQTDGGGLPRGQSVRPAVVSLSVESHFEAKPNISSGGSLSIPTTTFGGSKREREVEFRGKDSSLKRFADDADDEICRNRAKRIRGYDESDDFVEDKSTVNIWMQQPGSTIVPRSLPYVANIVSDDVTPWVDYAVKEVTDIGEENVVEPSQQQQHQVEVFGSSSSSESRGFSPRLNEKPPREHEIGDGSSRQPPYKSTEVDKVVIQHSEYEGFELISLLVACVEEIGSNNIPGINQIIARLGVLASPTGSPISRVAAYFTEAFVLRAVRLWPQVFHITPPRILDRVAVIDDDDSGTALRLLNEATPIPRFIYFTANEILLRVFEGKDNVHIIDFDIKQGLQWPGLFQSLASRTTPPSHIRVTGVGKSKHELIEVGLRLSGIADSLNLAFEFHPVVDRLEDVRVWMLHVKENETVAVNCMFQLHKMLYDRTGVFTDFLELIRSTNPKVLIMAEQEAEHDEDSLETRLVNSLRYYSAVFDLLDEASISPDQSSTTTTPRIKIEEMYGREIKNIIATEGNERFERHQGFGKWRRAMEKGGFRGVEISERELLQSKMLLKMYHHDDHEGENYSVSIQEGSGITIRWIDQPLYTVSAWEVLDSVAAADNSSSFGSSPFAKN